MRLLHVNEEGYLEHTDFTGETTPPYAILSHRWCEEEITFDDFARERFKIVEESGRTKASANYRKSVSFHKIWFCARQAVRDGLKFFWIDSCCIDKNDRYELSDAINSM